jgi:Protein of unknown function (DUF3489)
MVGLWVVGARAWSAVAQMEDHPMAKSNAKKRNERAKAPKRQTRRTHVVGTRSRTGKQTKQQICLDLLSQQEGSTIEELQAATGWQQHSVRGFLAGAVKKKLGLTLLSEKPDARPRRYRISDTV